MNRKDSRPHYRNWGGGGGNSMLKTMLPPRNPEHFERPELAQRLRLLGQRLTVLQAPCGFGKTSQLIDACYREIEREREEGEGGEQEGEERVKVVWIGCDEAATGETLLEDLCDAVAVEIPDAFPGHAPVSVRESRVGLLCRAIDATGKPCVLALDDFERVTDAEAGSLLNRLLRYGPANLHLAVAMRSNNCGLDLASVIAAGHAVVLGTEDLRFSKPEIARFMGRTLSRAELVSAVEKTAGWPIALRILNNLARDEERPGGNGGMRGYQETMSRYLGARLLRDLDPTCRELLLDAAALRKIELPILEKAFPAKVAQCWPSLSSTLDGLLLPSGSKGGSLRIHPLVQEFLTRLRRSGNMPRFMQANRHLAQILAQKGRLADALDLAAEARDPHLCGEVLQNHGGVKQLFAEGAESFLRASRHLNDEIVNAFPSLLPMYSMALLLQNRPEEAYRQLENYRQRSAELPPVASPQEERMLHAEGILIESILCLIMGLATDATRANRLLSEALRLAESEWLPLALRASLYCLLSVNDSERARFQLSQRRAADAKQCFGMIGSSVGPGVADITIGVNAMVQGKVRDAEAANARSRIRNFAAPLALELRIERNGRVERNGMSAGKRWAAEVPEHLEHSPGWFDVQAAAHGNRAEAAFEREGPGAAAEALEKSIDWATRRGVARLQRLFGGLRVSWLVAAGRTAAAQQCWDETGLPGSMAGILQLTGQSWRELEAAGCARVDLLGAQGEFDAARMVAHNLITTARGWGLQRTLMRCLVAAAVLEHRASNPARAMEHLREFTGEYRNVDYSRPLVRAGDAGVELMRGFLQGDLKPALRQDAERLQRELRSAGPDATGPDESHPQFTEKEAEVLKGLLQGRRNKQIARTLGITDSGVRYHLKRIYRILGATGRLDAVRRAMDLGLVFDSPDADEGES